MKLRHYITLVFGLVAAVVIAAYIYRDTIARNAANAILRNSGLQISGLSINSISTNTIDFDELILQTAGGTGIRVIGVVLPLNARSQQSGPLVIDEVELESSGGNDGPAPIAATLAAILDLPQTIPYSAVRISRVTYDEIPPLQDVTWEYRDQGQLLRFAISSFAVTTSVDSTDAANHRVSLTATTEHGIHALALALSVTPQDGSFEISGQSTTRVSPLIPALHAYEMLPVEFTRVDALLRGAVQTTIPADAAESFSIHGSLRPDGDMAIRHEITDQPSANLIVNESSSLVTTVVFPTLSWQADLPSGKLTFSKGDLQNIPVEISNLACTQGVICNVYIDAHGNELEVGPIGAKSVTFSGPLRMLIEDRTQIDFRTGSVLEFSDVQGEAFALSSIKMTDFRGAAVTIEEAGWQISMPQAGFAIQGLDTAFGLRGELDVALKNTEFVESGRRASSNIGIRSASAAVDFGGLTWKLPYVRGTLQLIGDEVIADAVLSSADNALKAVVSGRHDVETGSGALEIRGASVSFGARALSGFLMQAPKTWDVSAGTLSSDVSLLWDAGAEAIQMAGSGRIELAGAAGHYDDIVATGATTRLEVRLSTGGQLESSPASASVELLDLGFPVTDIEASYKISTQPPTILVDSADMKLLGGTAGANNFSYSPGSPTNDIDIRLENIQLPLMMAMAEFESVNVEGSVSGVLPATVRDHRIIIAEGRIEADEPGGAIRYLPGGAAAVDSQLGIAARALSNFQFGKLGADVTYDDEGDLALAMRIEGRNPDMDPNQPVIVNLSLENNVPAMLRSLRATRSIQEILEQRVNRRQ